MNKLLKQDIENQINSICFMNNVNPRYYLFDTDGKQIIKGMFYLWDDRKEFSFDYCYDLKSKKLI